MCTQQTRIKTFIFCITTKVTAENNFQGYSESSVSLKNVIEKQRIWEYQKDSCHLKKKHQGTD